MKRYFAGLMFISLLTAGCGGLGKEVKFDTVQTGAFVFGYIDRNEAPLPVEWVRYRPVSAGPKDPLLEFRVDEGLFYREDLAPAQYELARFGADEGMLHWWYPEKSSLGIPFTVATPGQLLYLGSYRLRGSQTNDPFDHQYSIEKTAFPSELEVLKKILPNAKGSSWEPLLRKRIQQLSADVKPTRPGELVPVQ